MNIKNLDEHFMKVDELKKFIIQNEFNDALFRKKFDETQFLILSHLSFLCFIYSRVNDDITYAEQTTQIAHTIMEKETISYKQFRVLCFFWKRYQYRKSNPIKDIEKKMIN